MHGGASVERSRGEADEISTGGDQVDDVAPTNGGGGHASLPTSPTSSSSTESSDSEEALDVSSYQDMKKLVDEMMGRGGDSATNANGEVVNGGPGTSDTKEGNGRPHGPSHPQAYEELFDTSEASLDALRASLRCLCVSEEEKLLEGGQVVGCLEGTVVVQACLGAANECLAEGSILVTEGRKVLGRIEDIFGPIEAPMYVLMDPINLYGGKDESDQAPEVQIGDTVWYVESLVKRIVDQAQLREVGVGEDVEIEGGDDDDDDDDDDGGGGGDEDIVDDVDDEMNAGEARGALEEQEAPSMTANTTKPAPRPSKPQQRQNQQSNQQPRTIAEWQSQQQASLQQQAPRPFAPVAFRRDHLK